MGDTTTTAGARRPGVTVVVPSWHRPEGLGRALDGLARQSPTPPAWDVVVVASAGDPGVAPVVEAARRRLPVAVAVVSEPRSGASAARNRGLRESAAVVAFLDDDCRPEPTWLDRITAPVLEGVCAGAGGRVVADPAVDRPRWLGDALLAYLAEYDRGPDESTLDGGDFVLTANAAFDTAVLDAVGGFDVELGPDAGRPLVDDDVDLCRRVMATGAVIRYVPGAVVVHDLPATRLSPAYLLRRMYAQGRSDWTLDRKSGGPRRPPASARAALSRLGAELPGLLGQGPWHPSVALHAAGAVARAAGYTRQSLAARPGRVTRR
ncbi:MAG TPA: glycosyltransferase family 2 protein [Acidimicrobiales bacterium]|nr:glycosyltransferase family 2 protein [Acidimicrobiales bacterium]